MTSLSKNSKIFTCLGHHLIFSFPWAFQEEGHFCGQGVVGDGAECGDAEHASSDERAEELHGSAANHNKVLREFFLTFLSGLVNCGEGEVALLIQRERENLRPDQFFDVDMVILMLVGNNNVEVYVRMTIAKEMGI